jgi:hypothetical protein
MKSTDKPFHARLHRNTRQNVAIATKIATRQIRAIEVGAGDPNRTRGSSPARFGEQ